MDCRAKTEKKKKMKKKKQLGKNRDSSWGRNFRERRRRGRQRGI